MVHFEPQEILAWTGGHLLRGTLRDCHGVFTDSRHPVRAGLFVALRGENFDGHDFLEEAARGGARGAVVMASKAQALNLWRGPENFFFVVVADTLIALQGLARGHRSRFNGPLIGITGSNGKTTTKEMIAACLGAEVSVLATHGNLNNEIGVPMTLLGLRPHHQACVVEMGTRGLGQIAQLVGIAEPTVGVVTNVGPVHLATLGDVDNVARAKAELVVSLPATGTAILNADDARVASMRKLTAARVITYAIDAPADVRAQAVVSDANGTLFDLHVGCERVIEAVRINVPGVHNVSNALAALAVGWACGCDLRQSVAALGRLQSTPMRLETSRLPADILLINDSYNASPLSMRAGLDVLKASPGRRRVAVLGDMLELGSQHEYYHDQIGRLAAESGVDLLICVGEAGRLMMAGAGTAGMPAEAISWYADGGAAADAVAQWLQTGDTVLVKASRGLELERVAAAVTAQAGECEGRGSQ